MTKLISLNDIIQGKNVSLRPANEKDKHVIYKWLTQSNTTPSFMGPPDFLDNPIPTWKTFCADYKPYFFDGSEPKLGRCFIIIVNGKSVGQINYDKIRMNLKQTELDIWMNREANCGRGYGSDALQTLCEYLFQTYGVVEFVIRPSARNLRAIRAYEKAGFQRVEITPQQQEAEYEHGDYDDDVVLIKKI